MAITVIFVAAKKLAKFGRKVVHMVDDFIGIPEREGEPAKPGLSHRLSLIEKELRPNGGTSLKDQVNRLEEWNREYARNHPDLSFNVRMN